MTKNKEIKINLLILNFFIFLISTLVPIRAISASEETKITLDKTYLESKGELDDYILDTGDILNIKIIDIPEFSRSVTIDEQGEIYLDRVEETYVRGLTINELENLLEESYKRFLIDPEIKIRLETFKPLRISINGEVRNPGIIIFDAFNSSDSLERNNRNNLLDSNNQESNFNNNAFSSSTNNQLLDVNNGLLQTTENSSNNNVKRNSDFVSTISNAINRAGGLTPYSDIKRIELIRDIPIGKGGGKKKTIIDFTSFLNATSTDMDLRLFDGDFINIPRSKERNIKIIRQSILTGITPKFINVFITGRIENPGKVRLPVEGTLYDLMSISGPRKPLSGKVFLIRYGRDGSLIRQNIKFSANATPGTKKNPYLLEGDIVSVKNSFIGRSSGVIKEVTQPFVGIVAGKEILDQF